MNKRIYSLLLVISMIVSLPCVSYGVEEASGAERESTILENLQIIPANDSQYIIEGNVRKNNFIIYVCNLIYGVGFDETNWDEAKALAEERGWIAKEQDDLFKTLPLEEAVAILVRALGFEEYAKAMGGYPSGYIKVGRNLGLADTINLEVGTSLMKNDVIRLLYQAMNSPAVEIVGVENDKVIYGPNPGKTALHQFRKIYRVEGVLESSGAMRIHTDASREEGEVTIQGYRYKTKKNFSRYLGRKVEAYVKETNSVFDEVLCMIPNQQKEITIVSADMIGVSSDYKSISYYTQNERKREARLSPIARVVYNGQPLETYTQERFQPRDGMVTLIHNDDDEQVDTVLIENYDTMVVDSTSTANQMVNNRYTHSLEKTKLELMPNNDTYVELCDKKGDPITFSSLTEGKVIRVAESVSGGYRVVRVIACEESLEGVVAEKMEKNDKTILKINQQDYELSPAYLDALKKADAKALELKLGRRYTFSLDDLGRIVYAKTVTGNNLYGIVYAVGVSDSAFEPDQIVKLYTTEGVWKEYTLEKKITFNEVKDTKAADAVVQLGTAKMGSLSVIEYTLNSDGKIDAIKTPEEYDNDGNKGRFNQKTDVSTVYRSVNSSYDGEYYIEDDAVIWYVDVGDITSEKSYSVGGPNRLENGDPCKLNAYNIDAFGFTRLFLIKIQTSNISNDMSNAPLCLVSDVGKMISPDGDEIGYLEVAAGVYSALTYMVEDDSVLMQAGQMLARGDVVSVYSDSSGVVRNVKLYHAQKDGAVGENPSSMYGITVIRGTVTKVDVSGNRIKLDCGTGTRSLRITSAPILIYDKKRDTIETGTLSDIDVGDYLVTKMINMNQKALIVNKE